MKNKLLILLVFISFLACKKAEKQTNTTPKKTTYHIKGSIFDKESEIVYLKLIKSNKLQIIDSSLINNEQFSFEGTVDFPKKAVIQLKNRNNPFFFILSNEQIEIALNTSQFAKSSVSNSLINAKLSQIQKQSATIYQKIDYLFPQLQKARMENDFLKLEEINKKINAIVSENQKFLITYIQENPNEYLSGLILNDLWNSSKTDSIQLFDLAKSLNPKVQKSIDFTIP